MILSKIFKLFFLYFFGFLFLFLIKFLSLFVKVKVNIVDSNRLGHFLAWAFTSIEKQKEFRINVICKKICNHFFLEKVRGKLKIIDGLFGKIFFFSYLINKKFFQFDIFQDYFPTGEANPCREKMSNLISFNQEELKKIKKDLRLLNINKKYICIHIRDEKYLTYHVSKKKEKKNSYRNANINKYKKLINFLISKNFNVVRLGKKSSKKLNLKNKNFVEYSNNINRSEMTEIFLILNCEFFVGVPSGLATFAVYNQKPVLHTNLVNFGHFDWVHSQFAILKKFYKKNKNKKLIKLDISEIISKNYHLIEDTKEFKSNKIVLKENTPQELYLAVKEVYLKVYKNRQKFKPTKLQKKFQEMILANSKHFSNFTKYKGNICNYFLEKNLNV